MMREGPIVHYLINSLDVEDKFKINDTAYLVNATQEGAKMYLQWVDNGNDALMQISYRSALFLKTDTAKSYYVRFKNVNECYITEYNDHYRKDEYLYYSKHINGKLIECGLVKGDVFVPFKQFEEKGMMTEYIYGYNNETGDIDVSTKTEVYHGTYINNPRKHYPRQSEEQTSGKTQPTIQPKNVSNAQAPPLPVRPTKNGETKHIEGGNNTDPGSAAENNPGIESIQSKPSTKPKPATKAISTDFIRNQPVESIRGSKGRPSVSAEKLKLTTNTKQIIEGDEWVLANGDKIQENTQYRASTLQFKEYYQDTSLTTLQINMLNFPYLKLLVFGNYVQNGVKGELLEISGCSALENIKFGKWSFNNYQRYVFTSMICYCIVNRFTKIEINRNG